MQRRLRKADAGDIAFCKQLYCTCMEPVMRPYPGWDAARLAQNFDAYFKLEDTDVILDERGGNAGWVQRQEKEREIFVSFMYLTAALRGQGTGTAILRDTLDRARASGKTCTLNAVKNNPRALSLYKRLGFAVAGEDNLKYFLKCA